MPVTVGSVIDVHYLLAIPTSLPTKIIAWFRLILDAISFYGVALLLLCYHCIY